MQTSPAEIHVADNSKSQQAMANSEKIRLVAVKTYE